MSSIILALSLGMLWLAIRIVCKILTRTRLPMPPGPRPLPFVGNILDAPDIIIPQTLSNICRRYGDLVHLNILRRPTIFVGTHSIASQLLDKRSSNYSDRPQSVMMDLIGASWTLLQYGRDWRLQRKVFHQEFNVVAVSQFDRTLEQKARELLKRLVDQPDAIFEAVKFITGAATVEIVYGLETTAHDIEYIALVRRAIDALKGALEPGDHLVEVFPCLRYIPCWLHGASDAPRWREAVTSARSIPFEATVENMRRGNAKPSMVSRSLERTLEATGEVSSQALAVVRDAAAMAYFAGPDTIASHVRVFFLAMSLYPDVQRKAQHQLDLIVGPERLPKISDRQSLPYVHALVVECMRWIQVNVLGFPHQSVAEDECGGYRIPAGSMIVPNIWAIAHDPRHYVDPYNFLPERFLTDDGVWNPDVLDPRSWAFGYGRRRCPSRHFSEASLFSIISSVLHTFVIEPRLDTQGFPILPPGVVKGGIFSLPKSFDCRVKVRSHGARELIVRESPLDCGKEGS